MLRKFQTLFRRHLNDPKPSEEQRLHSLQIAACVLLIEISRSDASVSEVEEETILRLLAETFSLDAEESKQLMAKGNEKTDEAISFYEFTEEIKQQFNAEERVKLIGLLWDVALADGEIDKYEDFYIRKIADLLYVSHSDFIRMKHKALDQAGQS